MGRSFKTMEMGKAYAGKIFSDWWQISGRSYPDEKAGNIPCQSGSVSVWCRSEKYWR